VSVHVIMAHYLRYILMSFLLVFFCLQHLETKSFRNLHFTILQQTTLLNLNK